MTAHDLSDEELMVSTRDGNRDAFTELIHRYQNPLVNYFRRMGARMDEAEDLVQETFMRLFAYRERYEPTGRLRNLLYLLARHAWADMARKQSRQPTSSTEAVEAVSVSDGLKPGEHLDVQSALDALSEKLRSVVVLNVYQGFKQREIAGLLDIPLGTVKSRLHLAFKQLKEYLCVEPVEEA